ncbi:HD domain-containing protein [uncultured Fretibacterium sp.]|uniref:HD domain-containing protein n=1 Tax=uncultured Fretibacterium sp. TaxID=1678694 RepID=UPI00262EAEED|nr:HD domain-containing protein [uncultured Fretibacterium sp.]
MVVNLEGVRGWFESYARGFDLTEPMLEMKYVHSRDVMRVGEALVRDLGWGAAQAETGVAACLLHDTGRFSQYRDFRTYQDGKSIDHGDRGYAVLAAELPRELADDGAREAILESVRLHNKRELPEELGEGVLPFCRLVRDADKLDVFRLVQRCMREGREAELLPSHRLGLPLSETLLDEVERTGRGSYANAASMLDYLLIQMTWTLDLNYAPSRAILRRSGILDDIRGRFPRGDARVQRVLERLAGAADS